ncbi:interleukin-5 [Microcaecilia unicolor]|uniref:Interleukin-5 n=1 Tax=Microcaecilia unicolor TaxID=1415580 RepID=A0A6P7YQ24_9AMPH|nr:interleukin-5-like [Microcaecilia unicolor]
MRFLIYHLSVVESKMFTYYIQNLRIPAPVDHNLCYQQLFDGFEILKANAEVSNNRIIYIYSNLLDLKKEVKQQMDTCQTEEIDVEKYLEKLSHVINQISLGCKMNSP